MTLKSSLAAVLFALSALLAAPRPGAAGDGPAGVWEGRIGTRPVMVCFWNADSGVYYDRRLGGLLLLTRKDKAWTETVKDAETGQWKIGPPAAGRLEGSWSDEDGHSRPIALKRVAGGKDGVDRDCGGRAFNAPREAPPRIARGRVRRLDGGAWQPITAKSGAISVATAALLDRTPGIARIDAELRAPLPDAPGKIGPFFGCSRNAASFGLEGGYDITLRPVLWRAGLVAVVERREEFCGGAHAEGYVRFHVWDARTGAPVDMAAWFTPAASRSAGPGGSVGLQPSEALKQAVRAAAHIGDCDGIFEVTDAFEVRPDGHGLVFLPDPPDYARACEVEIPVPFATLKPFLSPKGLAAVKALMP